MNFIKGFDEEPGAECILMAHWSSGKDGRFSIFNRQFNSGMCHQRPLSLKVTT